MLFDNIKNKKTLETLRWLMSTGLMFLILNKIIFLNQYGLEPYRVAITSFQLPEIIAFYGIAALMVELLCVFGLWVKVLFFPGVTLMSVMTIIGIGLSIWSLIFKLQSDCGCGLMGDNEYIILIQKVLILGVLYVLFRNKKTLFESD